MKRERRNGRKKRGGEITDFLKLDGPIGNKKLIISTGDISDVDGFYALAEYAKMGADCLFIMNYPQYMMNEGKNIDVKELEFGKGYDYSYEVTKTQMTDYAYEMAMQVWNEFKTNNTIYFCIGGINSINPFSKGSIKNEIKVYSDVVFPNYNFNESEVSEGLIYKENKELKELNINNYTEIYIDFNGSMAFLNDEWLNILEKIKPKLKGFFIMGGVYSNGEMIQTMPAVPNVLNRMSCCTMNQFYHPENAARFFNFIKESKDLQKITYTVSNNIVEDFTIEKIEKTCDTDIIDAKGNVFSYDPIIGFLKRNNLNKPFLSSIANKYYHTNAPPRKVFDYYTAIVLKSVFENKPLKSINKYLIYDNNYGITLINNNDDINNAIQGYKVGLNKKAKILGSFFEKTVENENNILNTSDVINSFSTININDVNFISKINGIIQIGGKRKPKKTAEKTKIELCIYKGDRNAKFVKFKGDFIPLKSIKKLFK